MKNAKQYYETTKNAEPHSNIRKFLKLVNHTGNAIDLGCGAGRDTVFLIKNGWNVTAIDVENTENIINELLSDNERLQFKFINKKFGDIDFNKCDLLVANYSLPFCGKKHFYKVWEKVKDCINTEGYFVGTFFGVNDSWNSNSNSKVFLTRNEVQALFKDFEIIVNEEFEKDGRAGINETKHWHIFDIIAKKN